MESRPPNGLKVRAQPTTIGLLLAHALLWGAVLYVTALVDWRYNPRAECLTLVEYVTGDDCDYVRARRQQGELAIEAARAAIAERGCGVGL